MPKGDGKEKTNACQKGDGNEKTNACQKVMERKRLMYAKR